MQDSAGIVKDRLRILGLADELGNVSKTCRRMGVSRTQFYEYRRRFRMLGPEGLKNLPPSHKTHPQTISEEKRDLILITSEGNPSWGCKRISQHLKKIGCYVSSPTVQKILERFGKGRLSDRM